ncbi:MAG: toxin-antitoxin system HicB family antitoxin [Verrucomicrobiota bacterium]
MSTLTIRLPDDKHARLRQLAKHRDISVNKLMEELATISIVEFDAETRFRALAARGSVENGLAVLDLLDAEHGTSGKTPD